MLAEHARVVPFINTALLAIMPSVQLHLSDYRARQLDVATPMMMMNTATIIPGIIATTDVPNSSNDVLTTCPPCTSAFDAPALLAADVTAANTITTTAATPDPSAFVTATDIIRSPNMTSPTSSNDDSRELDFVALLSDECPSSQGLAIMNQFIEHNSSEASVLHVDNRSFLLPAYSAFLLCDISRLRGLFPPRKYDVIVLDPPWENKSALRSKRFDNVIIYQ